MGKKSLYDVRLAFHHKTAGAFLVSETGDREKAIWLPRSEIEVDWDGFSEDDIGRANPPITAEVTMPQWLAEEKGLV